MAVNNSLKSKKIQIQDNQFKMMEGLRAFSQSSISNEEIKQDRISKLYQNVKKSIQEDQLDAFDKKVRKPYQQVKLLKSEYNRLISKKPYSFVAKIMGHKPY
ncbi:hypothetical protein [Cecembia calidifontis]|jgi:hypothetical protein|nr:hypothetical protein [Cecembia calidifontis]